MKNDFSTISAESNLRDEITVTPEEIDPTVNPSDEIEVMDPMDAAEERDELEMLREEPDDSMDGDFDSGMASAGMGCDEDYGYYGGDEGE
jgi:hypothetical protein